MQARIFTKGTKPTNDIGNKHWSCAVSTSEQILQTGKVLFTWALDYYYRYELLNSSNNLP